MKKLREYGTKTEYTRVIPVKDQIGPLRSDNAHRKQILRLGSGRGWNKPKNQPGNRNPLFTANPDDAEEAQMPQGRLLTPAFKLHQQVSADMIIGKWWYQAARDAANAVRRRKLQSYLGSDRFGSMRSQAHQQQQQGAHSNASARRQQIRQKLDAAQHQQAQNPITHLSPMRAHNNAMRPELSGTPRGQRYTVPAGRAHWPQ